MRRLAILALAAGALVAGVGAAPASSVDKIRLDTERAYAAAAQAGANPAACRTAIPRAMATRVAQYCRMVSGATYPPCNSLNRCEMMVDEIRGSCRDDPGPPMPCEASMTPEYWRSTPKLDAR